MSELHNFAPLWNRSMQPVLNATQMERVEQLAFDAGQASGSELMERAGIGVAQEVARHGTGIVRILCGPGNNGGDGYVAARALAEMGRTVEVFKFAGRRPMRGIAASARDRWLQVGKERPLDAFEVSATDLVVDALFGTGFRGPLDGACTDALLRASNAARLISVDILSGIDAATGKAMAPACFAHVRADITLAFQVRKCGHCLGQGGVQSGRILIVPLGLDAQVETLAQGSDVAAIFMPDKESARAAFEKHALHFKHRHGHAVVFAGPSGQGGAARLAARSALRAGSGLVTLAVSPAALAENAARLDAVMLTQVTESGGLPGQLSVDAVCLGPGLGINKGTCDRILRVLRSCPIAILDADALSAFANAPRQLFGNLSSQALLTPHLGEFRRLFPDLAERLASEDAYSRTTAACEAARRCGATVLLKGPDTVVARPGGRAVLLPAFDSRHAAWLATAGSGDVLAGFATGLMARGNSSCEAALWAAWLLLQTAEHCGPGLISEDLPEAVPAILREIFGSKTNS